jgi:hypothetical protein
MYFLHRGKLLSINHCSILLERSFSILSANALIGLSWYFFKCRHSVCMYSTCNKEYDGIINKTKYHLYRKFPNFLNIFLSSDKRADLSTFPKKGRLTFLVTSCEETTFYNFFYNLHILWPTWGNKLTALLYCNSAQVEVEVRIYSQIMTISSHGEVQCLQLFFWKVTNV